MTRRAAYLAAAPHHRKDTTAMHDTTAQRTPGNTGMQDAERSLGAALAAGVSYQQAGAHARDTAAWLLTAARTEPGRQYAAAYAETIEACLADVADAHPAGPPASTRPEGSPHPDPRLAAKGWTVQRGLYQRSASKDREAAA